MSFKQGNREQATIFPNTIDDYVGLDDPVRVYNEIIDTMDLSEFDFDFNDNRVGNSSYYPITMLKLLVYAYSYGWRSSRKIERATKHNVSFMWLMGGLQPHNKTISNFRKANKSALKKVIKQVVKICIQLGLIEGNILFLDGTKMRASASINKTCTKENLTEKLSLVDKNIEKLLNDCERLDIEEKENDNFMKLSKDLQDNKKLKKKLLSLVKQIEEEERTSINTTDPEARNMKGRQGSHTGYNAQAITDDLHGLPVSSDVINNANDYNQFTPQIENANSNLDKDCKVAVGDNGYYVIDDLKATEDKEITVIVPNKEQAAHKIKDKPYHKKYFIFNQEKGIYLCPAGNTLIKERPEKGKNSIRYVMQNKNDCLECPNYNKCTSSKTGRSITRKVNEETAQKISELYSSEKGQEIYDRRKYKIEPMFGHIKRNLNADYFLMKGIEGARAEFSILTSCFSICRMITILGGVPSMIEKLKILKI